MKSFESRLELPEAARANRRILKQSKMQRDEKVRQSLQSITPDNHEEMLQKALQACRTNVGNSVASLERREAAVRAAFRSVE